MYMDKINLLLFFIVIASVKSHIAHRAHLNALKKLCEDAYTCFHDTVNVCGHSVNEARTFLDICDLYEYSCEHNMVFRHVNETSTCPDPRELAFG